MARIVLITNAWGPKHGGINSFNTDFAKALSPVLAPETRVTCVVMDATPEEVEDAAKHGVRLLSLGIRGAERVDGSRALNVLEAVQMDGSDEVLWWVGHDVISGPAAALLPKQAGQGKSALIHHMSYVAYTAYKKGNALAAKKNEEEQRRLFRQADEVFAVGPLLRDSLIDLLDGSKTVRMIVPGLAEILPAPLGKTFSGITFGRLDFENDRIKQGRLAIAGFATACREANANTLYPKTLRDNPLLRVIGVSPSSEEEKELRAFATNKAGRVLNLLPLPYEEDRPRLFDELKRSSIAMMLSWHEGFGLTGWEAIAAEVPLVVSKNSGLYRLIDDQLGAPGLACLTVVDIRGWLGDLSDGEAENFHPDDEKEVSQAILKLASELDRRKGYAKTLRTFLSEQSDGYTWANCARSFADALGLPNQPEVLAPSATVTPAVSSLAMPALGSSVMVSGEPERVELPLLELKEPNWDPERGYAESYLLRAEEACVPFHESRRQLFNDVLSWATEPNGLSAAIQFRIGSAGAGKTRLMIEVCRELRRQGWRAGFLTSNLGQISEYTLKQFLANHQMVFVVVDYAETRRREVVELIRAAFDGSKAHRVRIMLLARDAGEWWNRLATDHPSIEPFLTGRAVSGPYRIPEVPLGEQNRESIFHEALEAFAKRLNKAHAGILPPDLSASHFANVLFIHLAAMASLSGERPETAISLLEATLRRERRYWHDAARAQGLPESLYPGLDQAVAIITLQSGANNGAEARRILESVSGLRGAGPDALNKILEVLRIFYSVSGRIDALRPDILGERLISQELAKDSALLETVLGADANDTTSQSALVVLNRLARQSPSDVIWLQRGLRQHLALRAGAAVAVAIEAGDPIGRVLAEVLDKAQDSEIYDLIEPLWKKMPEETIALRECALVLAQLRLERIEKKTKGKPTVYQQKLKLAEAYASLANRLGHLEEHQKALTMNEKALPFFKELAKLGAAQISNYAMCLMNASNCMLEVGKYTEALKRSQEAVKLFRELVKSNPRTFQKNLALALHNLAAAQQRLGAFEESYGNVEESWRLYRALSPGESGPEIARSYQALALTLSSLGRHDEAMAYAQQSFTIWTALAEKSPDAFQPLLAGDLRYMANRWLDAGQYKQAREAGMRAVNIFRELASVRPEVFSADLCQALATLASVLIHMGERQESLRLAMQGLEIERARIGIEPGVQSMHVAVQLMHVAEAMAELGQYAEAVPHAEESLALLRNIFPERPELLRSTLVNAHSLLAEILIGAGRLVDARELLLSGRPAFEELSKKERVRAVLPVRALFLSRLSYVQLQLDEHKSAIENARLATELYEENLRERPLVHREDASGAWRTRAVCEAAFGEMENAQFSATRGLQLLQADLVETPRRLSPWALSVARDLVRLAGPLADEASYEAVYMAIRQGAGE